MPSHGTACSSRAPPTCRSRSPRTPSLARCARSSTVDPARISRRMILLVEDNPDDETLTRPAVDFAQFVEAARQLGLNWLVLNQSPPAPRELRRGGSGWVLVPRNDYFEDNSPAGARPQGGRRAAARQRAAVPGAGRALERRRHAARSGRDDPVRQPIHAARARLWGDRKPGAECLRSGPPRRPP